MNTRNINLFVFDLQTNFLNTKHFIGESIFKRIICVENLAEFAKEFNLLKEDDYVFLIVHAFFTNKISGIRRFVTSGIIQDYENLGYMIVSEGDSKKIKIMMIENGLDSNNEVYYYHQVASNLQDDKLKAITKAEIIRGNQTPVLKENYQNHTSIYEQFDYAIITALYQDEFEELKKVFDFPKEEIIKTVTKQFRVGYLKSNRAIKVIAGIPNVTGMIDSAILATQMLEFFKPKYLLMSGVCGGSENFNFGDIIVAKQIFAFQKGKLSDHPSVNFFDDSDPDDEPKLLDEQGNVVDYHHLFDNKQNQVSISIDHFELEHDAMINLNTLFEDSLIEYKENIQVKINQGIKNNFFFSKEVNLRIVIEPMASGTMVINKKGFFNDVIKAINRRTAAVEMESYSIARACQIANDGKTIPIIFKAVMDHTFKKADSSSEINYKKFAAYTSAQFMRYLFEDGII